MCSDRTLNFLLQVPARGFATHGINDYIVQGRKEAVNPEYLGTKAAAHYLLTVGAGETKTVRLRLKEVVRLAFG